MQTCIYNVNTILNFSQHTFLYNALNTLIDKIIENLQHFILNSIAQSKTETIFSPPSSFSLFMLW